MHYNQYKYFEIKLEHVTVQIFFNRVSDFVRNVPHTVPLVFSIA